MEKITVDNPLDLAIDLDVPREMVLQRLSARRVCRDCGTNYTATGRNAGPGCATSAAATSSSVRTTPRTPSTPASTGTRPRPAH